MEFASKVSHELRTPLTVIKESIGILLDGVAGPVSAAQKEYLQVARNNVDRLVRLINDVLDFQKIEAGQRETRLSPCGVNQWVQGVLPELTALGKQKGLEVAAVLSEGLPEVPLDKEWMTRVLVNLVGNAVKFSEKGKVTLRTDRFGNGVRVSVQDEGVGIRAEDIPKLFQQFVRLQYPGVQKSAGSGLGLAICRKIVEAHRGKIGVESVYGKGSTFWFLLPMGGDPEVDGLR